MLAYCPGSSGYVCMLRVRTHTWFPNGVCCDLAGFYIAIERNVDVKKLVGIKGEHLPHFLPDSIERCLFSSCCTNLTA
jgi:hypothetical protein